MHDPRIDMAMPMPLLPEIVQSEVANPWLRVRPRAEMMGMEPAAIA